MTLWAYAHNKSSKKVITLIIFKDFFGICIVQKLLSKWRRFISELNRFHKEQRCVGKVVFEVFHVSMVKNLVADKNAIFKVFNFFIKYLKNCLPLAGYQLYLLLTIIDRGKYYGDQHN